MKLLFSLPIVCLTFSLIQPALAVVDDESLGNVSIISERCDAEADRNAQLDCYKSQLEFLASQGSVQSEELFLADKQSTRQSRRCYRGICIGDTVFYRESKQSIFKSEVVDLTELNKFAIKIFEDTGSLRSLKYDLGIGELSIAKGCLAGLCVGDESIQMRTVDGKQTNYYVKIVGINFTSNELAVEYRQEDGFTAMYGDGWDYDKFALTSGCVKHVCVGQEYLNKERSNVRVKVVGLRMDNKFLIEYLEGDFTKNKAWGFWNAEDFLPLQN